jgi:hypothetical protein
MPETKEHKCEIQNNRVKRLQSIGMKNKILKEKDVVRKPGLGTVSQFTTVW